MKRIKGLVAVFTLALTPLLVYAQADDALNLRFTPPETDLSLKYLASIFGIVGGVLHGIGTQIMGAMFGVFNSAVLSLGGIVVMYVLVVSIMNTAHDGEVLGKKWSSVWLPLRSAIGVGLLLPKSTGYSVIQVFVMWVVVQGVGAADSIWDSALNYIGRGGVVISSSFQPSIAGGNAAKKSIESMFLDLVCVYQLQKVLDKKYVDSIGSTNELEPVPPLGQSINPILNSSSGSGQRTIQFPNLTNSYWSKFNGACGSISWTPYGTSSTYTSGGAHQVSDARTVALQQMILFLSQAAQSVVNSGPDIISPPTPSDKVYVGQCPVTGSCNFNTWNIINGVKEPSLLAGDLLQKAYATYYGVMLPALRAAARGITGDTNKFTTNGWGYGLPSWIREAHNQGWIMAGSYYYKIARVNDSIRMQADTALPKANPPKGLTQGASINTYTGIDMCSDGSSITTPLRTYLTDSECKKVQDLMLSPQVLKFTSDSMNDYVVAGTRSGSSSIHGARVGGGFGKGGILLFPFIGPIMQLIGAFNDLSSAEARNSNPLIIMTNMGSAILGVCASVFILGAIISVLAFATGAIPCTNITNGWTVLATFLVPFFTTICTILMIAGSTLAFYIPMIPFIVFTFAAVGWLIGVIEAMVAAPIVALGFIHPEGHEHFGKSDQAIMLLTNVFLRPGMMVIGLIAGTSLSYVGVWILNAGWGEAAHMARGQVSGFAVIYMPIAFCVIYAALGVAMLHKAFSLIHIIPDKVLRWLSGGHQESLGAESAGEALSMAKGGTSTAAQYGGQGVGQGQGAVAQSQQSHGAQMDSEARAEQNKKNATSAQASQSGGEAKGGADTGNNEGSSGASGSDGDSGGTGGNSGGGVSGSRTV